MKGTVPAFKGPPGTRADQNRRQTLNHRPWVLVPTLSQVPRATPGAQQGPLC